MIGLEDMMYIKFFLIWSIVYCYVDYKVYYDKGFVMLDVFL